MKIFYFILFLAFNKMQLLAQPTNELSLGYSRYMNHYTDYKRTNGFSIGYAREWQIQEKFAVNVGMKTSLIEGFLYEYYYTREWINSSEPFYIYRLESDSYPFHSVNLYLPAYLISDIYKSKLFILSGLDLNIEHLLTFTSFRGTDPEIGSVFMDPSNYDGNDCNNKRRIGFGYHIGLLYKPLPAIGFTCEMSNTNNKKFSFNYISMGVKYFFIKKSISNNN